jgi:translation initiation factor IF-3
VIDPEGLQLGIMGLAEARKAADDMSLDLIEVAPNAAPPVCRIMDYGKFRYEQRKKAKEAQKKSKQTEMKMVRVRPNTDDHDMDFKMRNALKFLGKGNKVKFTVIFRGPELRHKEIGERQLNTFAKGCTEIAQVDQPPRMEGRRMTMILEPRPEALARIAAERAKAAAEGRRHELDEELPPDDSHLEDEDEDDDEGDDLADVVAEATPAE